MNINVPSLQAAHLKWMNASLGQRWSCTNTRSSLKLNCFVMCTCLKEQRGRGAETDRTGIRGYWRNVLYIWIIYRPNASPVNAFPIRPILWKLNEAWDTLFWKVDKWHGRERLRDPFVFAFCRESRGLHWQDPKLAGCILTKSKKHGLHVNVYLFKSKNLVVV